MKRVIIPMDGWAARERVFRFHADTEFFHGFDNKEILDADVDVEIRAAKEGTHSVKADLHLRGTVTVPCDRCLEPLRITVEAAPEEEFTASQAENWDMSQEVYDYTCLAIPLKRVHPDGECDAATVRFLGHSEPQDEEAAPSSPFAALKGLFE